MRLLISTLIVSQLVAIQSCSSRKTLNGGQSWLSAEYVECLKVKLPCECEKEIEAHYYSLVLDADSKSKNFGVTLSDFDQMEPYLYPIKELAVNVYAVYREPQDTASWAKIIVKDEELKFTQGNKSSVFIQPKTTKSQDPYHYVVDNVTLLNDAFTSRGYPALDKILNEDSLRCDCNKWIGGRNVLYVKGAPKSWIITMRDKYLVIDRITNVDRDPDDSVQIEKVIDFKWNE